MLIFILMACFVLTFAAAGESANLSVMSVLKEASIKLENSKKLNTTERMVWNYSRQKMMDIILDETSSTYLFYKRTTSGTTNSSACFNAEVSGTTAVFCIQLDTLLKETDSEESRSAAQRKWEKVTPKEPLSRTEAELALQEERRATYKPLFEKCKEEENSEIKGKCLDGVKEELKTKRNSDKEKLEENEKNLSTDGNINDSNSPDENIEKEGSDSPDEKSPNDDSPTASTATSELSIAATDSSSTSSNPKSKENSVRTINTGIDSTRLTIGMGEKVEDDKLEIVSRRETETELFINLFELPCTDPVDAQSICSQFVRTSCLNEKNWKN